MDGLRQFGPALFDFKAPYQSTIQRRRAELLLNFKSFFRCIHARKVYFECQGNTYWNNAGHYCDHPANVNCNEGEPIEEDEKIVSLPLTQVWTQDKPF